jgi:hypothetical protein
VICDEDDDDDGLVQCGRGWYCAKFVLVLVGSLFLMTGSSIRSLVHQFFFGFLSWPVNF